MWRHVLEERGLRLPDPPKAVGVYRPVNRIGDLLITSGQLPLVNGELTYKGKLGDGISVEQGRDAAVQACLAGLAALATQADLDQLRIVRVMGYVAATPEFEAHPQVVNGASELLVALFGESGEHARSAIGVSSLPLGAPVEIELWAQVQEICKKA